MVEQGLPEFVTVGELASILRQQAHTIQRWARSGVIPEAAIFRPGREILFRRDIIEVWITGGDISPRRGRPPIGASNGRQLNIDDVPEATGATTIEPATVARAVSPSVRPTAPRGTETASRPKAKRSKGKRRQYSNAEAREMLRRLAEEFDGVQSAASKAMAINRTTLQKWAAWYPAWQAVPDDDGYVQDPGMAKRRAVVLSDAERERLRAECVKRHDGGKGETQTAIARDLNISQAMVSKLIRGE